MVKRFTIRFKPDISVPALLLSPESSIPALQDGLILPDVRGCIIVVGGAAQFDADEYKTVRVRVQRLLDQIMQFAAVNQLAIVDGGTDVGVMRLLGNSRSAQGYTVPLIGVAPVGTVTWPGCPDALCDGSPLNPHHSAFILVDSDKWGDEIALLAQTGRALAGYSNRVVEILINGGPVSREDIVAYEPLDGPLIVIEGSGRYADEIARSLRRTGPVEPVIERLVATGQLHVFDLSAPLESIQDLLYTILAK